MWLGDYYWCGELFHIVYNFFIPKGFQPSSKWIVLYYVLYYQKEKKLAITLLENGMFPIAHLWP